MLKMNFYRCFLGFGTRLEHVSGVFTVRYSFFQVSRSEGVAFRCARDWVRPLLLRCFHVAGMLSGLLVFHFYEKKIVTLPPMENSLPRGLKDNRYEN